ncbi:hypothetical protein HD554DRAFT_214718 [Boletus coccyginus]|nr:hypothetical protein HD554DRAFT_214718 [Boletus coccyginus]
MPFVCLLTLLQISCFEEGLTELLPMDRKRVPRMLFCAETPVYVFLGETDPYGELQLDRRRGEVQMTRFPLCWVQGSVKCFRLNDVPLATCPNY